jgi:hypothetical protein
MASTRIGLPGCHLVSSIKIIYIEAIEHSHVHCTVSKKKLGKVRVNTVPLASLLYINKQFKFRFMFIYIVHCNI